MAWKIKPLVKLLDADPPGADTDILSTPLKPSDKSSAFRFSIVLETASVFYLTLDGRRADLNEGRELDAAAAYTFTFGAFFPTEINLRIETDGRLRYLLVEEVQGGVI